MPTIVTLNTRTNRQERIGTSRQDVVGTNTPAATARDDADQSVSHYDGLISAPLTFCMHS